MSKIYPAKGLIGGGFGDLDEIDGLSLIDGDAAIVITSDGVYNYTLNATSAVAENSPYIISPDDNAGDKRWELVSPVGAMSHVVATSSSGQSMPDNTLTTVIYETEIKDTLSEYDHTTGIFTATYDGLYKISACAQFNSLAWAEGDELALSAYVGAVETLTLVMRVGYTATYRTGPSPINTTLSLSASDAVTVKIKQNSTGSRALQNSVHYNRLTIDRIA